MRPHIAFFRELDSAVAGRTMLAVELAKGAVEAGYILDFPATASGVVATSATTTPAPTRKSRLLLIPLRNISIPRNDPNLPRLADLTN
jgi:hypothetical protein